MLIHFSLQYGWSVSLLQFVLKQLGIHTHTWVFTIINSKCWGLTSVSTVVFLKRLHTPPVSHLDFTSRASLVTSCQIRIQKHVSCCVDQTPDHNLAAQQVWHWLYSTTQTGAIGAWLINLTVLTGSDLNNSSHVKKHVFRLLWLSNEC